LIRIELESFNGDGLYINSCEELSINDLKINNSKIHGISNIGNGILRFENCYITDCVGIGVYNYAELYFTRMALVNYSGSATFLLPTKKLLVIFLK
jgi:hypothetical protein